MGGCGERVQCVGSECSVWGVVQCVGVCGSGAVCGCGEWKFGKPVTSQCCPLFQCCHSIPVLYL